MACDFAIEYQNFNPRNGMPEMVEDLRQKADYSLPDGCDVKIFLKQAPQGFAVQFHITLENKTFEKDVFVFKENVNGQGRHWIIGLLAQAMEDIMEEAPYTFKTRPKPIASNY